VILAFWISSAPPISARFWLISPVITAWVLPGAGLMVTRAPSGSDSVSRASQVTATPLLIRMLSVALALAWAVHHGSVSLEADAARVP
jgi:hypothetical protein